MRQRGKTEFSHPLWRLWALFLNVIIIVPFRVLRRAVAMVAKHVARTAFQVSCLARQAALAAAAAAAAPVRGD